MVITVRKADFAADQAAIRGIRFRVFVDEQNVPAEIEIDDRDPHCIHLLAFDGTEAVGTARIDLDRAGKIGRLAVRANRRRRGVGRALMQRCHAIAAAHGLSEVWCHAQVSAVSFYASLGYEATGEPFDEAGIEHLEMRLSLAA